jgi:two-component system, NtrC family, sensor kinase
MKNLAEAPEQEEVQKPQISISSVVMADESATQSRDIIVTDLPAHWIDGLLDAVMDVPIESGERAAVQIVIDVMARVMPQVHVGATIIRDGETVVLRAAAVNDEPRVSGERSSRMFPTLANERAIDLPKVGLTLHLGSDEQRFSDADAVVRFTSRAGDAIRTTLDRVHAYEHSVALRRELDAQREQLIFAEKLATLGQMAAGLVHELNNPLTAIVAYTDFLIKRAAARGEDGQHPDETERLRRIAESAHRMQRFTRDLVTYARPSGDAPQPVVVSSIVDQALSFCEHLLDESGVTVAREFGDGVLPVRGMPEQLAQVFVNLVTNACHAMPKRGGRLVVRTEIDEAEAHVKVTVEDNGHGVPQEHLSRVFLPFFTTKSEGHGTGLGLAIVKNIIEAHDGAISVQSDPSFGTRFLIVLPVAQGPLSQRIART